MPQFNLPSKDDPDYNDKVSNLLGELFGTAESNVKNFPPIKNPEEGLQIGSVWFDEETETLKVNTSSGIKTLQYV